MIDAGGWSLLAGKHPLRQTRVICVMLLVPQSRVSPACRAHSTSFRLPGTKNVHFRFPFPVRGQRNAQRLV